MYMFVHSMVGITFIQNHRLDRTDIDHVNGDILNNSMWNLRWITHAGNVANRRHGTRRKEQNLAPNVVRTKEGNRFEVKFMRHYKTLHFGTYLTPEIAKDVAKVMRRLVYRGD